MRVLQVAWALRLGINAPRAIVRRTTLLTNSMTPSIPPHQSPQPPLLPPLKHLASCSSFGAYTFAIQLRVQPFRAFSLHTVPSPPTWQLRSLLPFHRHCWKKNNENRITQWYKRQSAHKNTYKARPSPQHRKRLGVSSDTCICC